MHFIVIIIGFLMALWAFSHFLNSKTSPYHKRKTLLSIGIIMTVIGLVYLALTGKLVWMIGLLSFWIPWALRSFAFYRFIKRTQSYQPDNQKPSQEMSRAEALDILGLNEDASTEDINRAYKRLISRLHPDLEGSTHLASLVNKARDTLL